MIRKPSLSIDQVEKLERSGVKLFEEAEEKKDQRKEKKEFLVGRTANGLYNVRLSAGGEVPQVLSGMWTTGVKAEAAIADYLRQRAASSR